MSWRPWRRWVDDAEPAVSDEDRAHLEHARRATEETTQRVTEQVGEADRLGRYLRKQRNVENHLVTRLRQALGGGGG